MVKKLYLLSILIIILDRILKFYFSQNEFGIFQFKLNTGAAFGILKGWNWFLIVFSLIVIGVILYHRKNEKLELGMGFLLGGTISNLIDRAVYGGVIDYIKIDVLKNIFNLADVANIIGAGVLIYYFWKE
jgi:signal peptidase II|tara:strand:- start:189 stop:578 length:390 start_codon:yes stop_codon:yes gene_type:complete